MPRTTWVLSAALIGIGMATAQGPGAQSPASRPGPQTVTPQTYPAGQIRTGEQRFVSQCGFCHGRDAAGGETGRDLTRSALVAEDMRGDKIGPFLRAGRPDQGMPAFRLNDADRDAIVAFIHDQKTKFETLGGGRRAGCHSPTGDLAGIATRYTGLTLLQRMLYPSGRPAPARPTITVTLASGETVTGSLASEDEFTVVVLDAAGSRQTYEKSTVKFKIDDPMSAHFTQLGKYTDSDMHNIFAYLDTLK
jgi:cytochrome c oxidase cbb3-type subunit 3